MAGSCYLSDRSMTSTSSTVINMMFLDSRECQCRHKHAFLQYSVQLRTLNLCKNRVVDTVIFSLEALAPLSVAMGGGPLASTFSGTVRGMS